MFFAVPLGGIDFTEMLKQLEEEHHPLVSLIRDIATNSSILESTLEDFRDYFEQRKAVSFIEGKAQRALIKVLLTFERSLPANSRKVRDRNGKGEWRREGPERVELHRKNAALNLPYKNEERIDLTTETHSSVVKLGRQDKGFVNALRIFHEWIEGASVVVPDQFCT